MEPAEENKGLIKCGEAHLPVPEDQLTPKTSELIQRGEIKILNPGFGPEQDQLSIPIAMTIMQLPDGKRALVVSNALYQKEVQIFDFESEELIGTVNDPRFNGASAMTSDGEDIYIADNSTGLIAKFSSSGTKKEWEVRVPINIEDLPGEVSPDFDISQYKHTGMIGSMVVSGKFLYVYNTAASKIQIFNKKTGELVWEIGEHKVISLDQAQSEDLTPDKEVRFNGHADIAMLGDQIITSQGGVHWEGAFELPNEIKIISQDGKLKASAKLSVRAGEINGIAVDNRRKEVYLAIGNIIGVWNENGFVGEFKIPNCPGGLYGRVFKIYLDERSGDLIVSHGAAGLYDPALKKSVPNYSQIIRLSRTAREELMKEAANQRKRMLEAGQVLELGIPEHLTSDDEELLIYADRNEGVIECQSENPSIKEVFDLTINPQTGKYRAVAVNIHRLPIELRKILEFVGKLDYVTRYTDEIIFSPILRAKGGFVPDRSAVTAPEQSIAGAVINMESVYDQHIRPGRRIMFINIGKLVDGILQPREEVEMFDRIVHEARHRETIEKVANGEEPSQNLYDKTLFERPAYEMQLEVLSKVIEAYEERGLVNNALYLYLLDRLEEVKTQLNALNRKQ